MNIFFILFQDVSVGESEGDRMKSPSRVRFNLNADKKSPIRSPERSPIRSGDEGPHSDHLKVSDKVTKRKVGFQVHEKRENGFSNSDEDERTLFEKTHTVSDFREVLRNTNMEVMSDQELLDNDSKEKSPTFPETIDVDEGICLKLLFEVKSGCA